MTRLPVRRTLPFVGLVGLALGCTAPQPARGPATTEAPVAAPLVLPLGEWTGVGHYCVLENLPAATTQPAELRFRSGLYPTSLKIERTTLAGEPVLCIDVLSLSDISGSRGRTHVLIYLDPEPTTAAGAPLRLYRVRQAGFSLEEGAEMQFQTGGAGIGVSVMRDADDTVLRVESGQFLDCLRFRGTRLTKDGVFSDGQSLRVYWSETLERRPPP